MHGLDATLMMGLPGTERVLWYVYGKNKTYTFVDEKQFLRTLGLPGFAT